MIAEGCRAEEEEGEEEEEETRSESKMANKWDSETGEWRTAVNKGGRRSQINAYNKEQLKSNVYSCMLE
jgi:hypothetical protein